MRDLGGATKNLAGSLLVAHPGMGDPNFRRSVLYISAHDPDEGALGVIINRPLDKQVADVVNEAPSPALAGVPVFLGGPVGRNQLMFAAFEWEQGNGVRISHNVGIEEAAERMDADPASVCAFVGYAGWSAGQLENEMAQQAWVLQKPDAAFLRRDRLPNLWFDIMRGLGPWFKLLAAAPDDPSLN
jgi:putative transcriptional regulator